MFNNNNLVPAYANNPLIAACGNIRDTSQIISALTFLPELPGEGAKLPFYIRKHLVPSIRDLYIPTPVCISLAETIDVMLRQGYSKRRPGTNDFWNTFYSKNQPPMAPSAASVVGISGMGKTVTIEKILNLYPQTFVHENFPGYKSRFKQLVWLKVDAPESGKIGDFAYNLMVATNLALESEYFDVSLKKVKRDSGMFDEWLEVAKKHALGILVIDEIQNFFKLAPKKDRLKNKLEEKLELRIVDDQTLKSVLTLTNSLRMPILASGTPDGLAIFKTRLSTAERLSTDGHHSMSLPISSIDKDFSETMFPILSQYQWVKQKMPVSAELRDHLYELTAAIPRVYKSLWMAAHKVAFERGEDKLTIQIFTLAMNTYLKPVIPAIQAIKSNSPHKLKMYEDILPRDHQVWSISM